MARRYAIDVANITQMQYFSRPARNVVRHRLRFDLIEGNQYVSMVIIGWAHRCDPQMGIADSKFDWESHLVDLTH